MSEQVDLWGESFGADPFAPESVPKTEGDFQPIPPGLYAARIDSAVMKRTQSGTGIYLAVEMTIAEGLYTNRKLWDNLNTKNPSAIAQSIGLQKLATIGTAVGLKQIQPGDLDGKVLCVRVGVDKDRNKVLAYKPYAPTSSPQPASEVFPGTGTTAAQGSGPQTSVPENEIPF